MKRDEYLSRAYEFAARGRQLKHARMHECQVRAIRERNRLGVPMSRMARQYGVHVRTIEKACAYETWAHL